MVLSLSLKIPEISVYPVYLYTFFTTSPSIQASQVALVIKNPPVNVGDLKGTGLIPGSGRSPGEGHGNPL